MKHAKVQRQEKHDAQDETRPVPWRDLNQGHHNRTASAFRFLNWIIIVILIVFGGSKWD